MYYADGKLDKPCFTCRGKGVCHSVPEGFQFNTNEPAIQ